MEASFACRADSRRSSDFPKQNRHGFSRGRGRQKGERYGSEISDESELLSSKNGSALSPSGTPKFQSTAAPGPREKEIVELFRKVQAQLRERGAAKEERKMEALQGQSKENETVDSLLKLLRKHSVEHGKKNNKHGGGGGDSSRDVVVPDPPKQDGSFYEEQDRRFSRSSSAAKESPERNVSSGRPESNFQRKSPIPRAKTLPSIAPEPEHEAEAELESLPELEPEHIFSDELGFDGVENSENDASDNDDDGEEPRKSRDLTALKLTELRSLAKSCGMKGFSRMKKSELVEVLSRSSL